MVARAGHYGAIASHKRAAALAEVISPPVGVRWFRKAGGIALPDLSSGGGFLAGRNLPFAEYGEIAALHSQTAFA